MGGRSGRGEGGFHISKEIKVTGNKETILKKNPQVITDPYMRIIRENPHGHYPLMNCHKPKFDTHPTIIFELKNQSKLMMRSKIIRLRVID